MLMHWLGWRTGKRRLSIQQCRPHGKRADSARKVIGYPWGTGGCRSSSSVYCYLAERSELAWPFIFAAALAEWGAQEEQ
jgi:hypothetical protein